MYYTTTCDPPLAASPGAVGRHFYVSQRPALSESQPDMHVFMVFMVREETGAAGGNPRERGLPTNSTQKGPPKTIRVA